MVQSLYKTVTVIMCLVALITPGMSQISQYQINDTVVISATSSPRNAFESGRNVSVLGRKDLLSTVETGIGSLLSGQTSLWMTGAGQSLGANQSLFVRGTESHQTLIVFDGLVLTDPSTINDVVNLTEITTGSIGRVEVLRGGHSTLMGSGAIGGVVSTYSLTPEKDGLNIESGLGYTVYEGGGSGQTFTGNIGYQFNNGFYLMGGINASVTTGLNATVDTISRTDVYRSSDNDDFNSLDGMIKIGYKGKKWRTHVLYKHIDQDVDIDDGAYRDDDNHQLDYNRDLFAYHLKGQLSGNFIMEAFGGYTTNERVIRDDSSAIDDSGKTDQAYAMDRFTGESLQQTLRLKYLVDRHIITAGFAHRSSKMSAENIFYSSAFNFGSHTVQSDDSIRSSLNDFFLQLELNGLKDSNSSFLSDLSFVLGARLNTHNEYSPKLTWHVNPIYRISSTANIYGLVSSSYFAPSLYHLYNSSRHYLSGITRGNQELTPEFSTNYEIGANFLIKNVAFKFSAYHSSTTDLIEYVYLWDKNIPISELGNDFLRDDSRGDTYLNVGRYNLFGLEAEMKCAVTEQIEVLTGINWHTGKIQYTSSDLSNSVVEDYHVQIFESGQFLSTQNAKLYPLRRPFNGNLSVHYDWNDHFKIGGQYQFTSGRRDVFYDVSLGPWGALGSNTIDPYSIVNLFASYTYNSITARLFVNNLLNTEYQEIFGFANRPRSVTVKIDYLM